MTARDEFERCWPWLESALNFRGFKPTHSKQDLWQLLANGQAFFYPGEKCAIVSQFWHHPTGLKTAHGWLAGGTLYELKGGIGMLEECAREADCNRIIINGPEQWARALDGFKVLGARLIKEL